MADTAVPQIKNARRVLMTHYMPWFMSKPHSGQWGWHWTMNHYDPEHQVDGRREAASHYRPLIGLYDSNDPDALQCQVMLMKLSGIDGAIIDWYGNEDFLDYGINNRSTLRFISFLQKAGMKFAICYEDQTVPRLIEANRFPAADAVAHAQRLMQWMQKNFFSSPAYVKITNRPVLLTFGSPYYNDTQWNQIFSVLPQKPWYFTETVKRAETAAVGGFDWPLPQGGTEKALREQDLFHERAKGWPLSIAAAFSRFHDIYDQAGVHKSWGHIEDRNGRTYVETLTRAMKSSAPIIQLVTWNDWGEGTQIEPSAELGYRDLEATQRLRRQYLEPKFSPTGQDLRLPVEWYLLRKKHGNNPAVQEKLGAFFPLVSAGRLAQAKQLLARYKTS
jgi:hypothetical protein